MDVVSNAFWRMLMETHVDPMEVVNRLCGGNNCFVLRSEKYIEHLFSELYSVPENIKIGYFKVKILELLLMLSCNEPGNNQMQTHTIAVSQVELAHKAAEYLLENMNQHIKIAELSKMFNVSDTHLKNVFKSVYGVPVFSFVRVRKMQSAAQILVHTERSVMDVASEFGYNNSSKFTAAFQQIMGKTPSEYRRIYGKKGLL